MLQAFLLGLCGAYGHLDWGIGTPYLNRPIILGPLVGLILGDFTTGIVIGATLEVFFLGQMAIGSYIPPDAAVGGVLGTMVFGVLVTVIYSVAADRMEAFTRSNIGVSMYIIIALLACVAAVLGIYGDLFASVVKRQCGIKDYGTIFPGHGGILDRFDSVMFIAPFVSIAVRYFFYLL